MNARAETAGVEPANTLAASSDSITLTPGQLVACQKVERMLAVTPIVALGGTAGSGRSTILRLLASKYRGKFVSLREVLAATAARGPDVSDAAVGSVIESALARSQIVFVDNFESLLFGTFRRPAFFMRIVLKRLYRVAINSGKRLVMAGPTMGDAYGGEVPMVVIPAASSADYAVFARNILGKDRAAGIDFKLVYDFASLLNGHQLRRGCELLAGESVATADKMIRCLERCAISANTRTEAVEALSFESLPGMDEIVSRLDTHIVVPMEHRALAQRLGLKPKRGVLLYGPPGTGKTSIGRALAHRMQGKFFLIDGSFVSEPPQEFFTKIKKVIQEAKENSPSVLFIDDADVLFKIGHIAGLTRYLLSLLDGVESATASNVCVMLTAADVRKLPEALLRSGRVELWLETKPPEQETRGRILQRWVGSELPGHATIDYATLAAATAGFTPADLRRIVGDAKVLYAADKLKQRTLATATAYLRRAIADLIAVRARMADSLGDERLRLGETNRKSKYGAGVGGVAATGGCATPGW